MRNIVISDQAVNWRLPPACSPSLAANAGYAVQAGAGFCHSR
jgi:hypothetical protein